MWRIEPVPSRHRLEALRFLGGETGGRSGSRHAGRAPSPADLACQAQTLSLIRLAEGPPRASLWWAWDARCVAAAMILEQAGRTGFLFPPAPATAEVDAVAMAQVARSATREALQRGLYFVQVSAPVDDPASIAAATAWGYEFVAELIYMSLALPAVAAPPRVDGLSWRDLGRGDGPGGFTEEELGELILATYEGSLDCPSLLRLRGARDIIASHKAGGVFHPQSWWIADVYSPAGADDAQSLPTGSGQTPRQGSRQAAGCILVNDRALEDAAEIAYLGVRPAYRGKGLAGRMIAHAAADALQRGLGRLQLAVDARNAPAIGAYERAGFRATHRKWIGAAIRRDA